MNILKFVSGLRFKSIGKVDFGVLKVAFIVAALDGDVTDDEYETFWMLAKRCKNYTEASAAKALDEAMRSAGYLLLLSKRAKTADFTKAFIKEASAALPFGFTNMPIADIRSAIVTWIAMAMSDGDYSARERKCIEALRRLFAEQKAIRLQQDAASSLISVENAACCVHGIMPLNTVQMFTKDFVANVEDLVAQLGDSREAEKTLKALIASDATGDEKAKAKKPAKK